VESRDKQQQANDHENHGRKEALRFLLCAPHSEGIGFGRSYLELGAAPIGTVGQLLIDCEEDQTLRAVLVGMLRKIEWR
jgi:hypothetical protein